MRVKFELPQLSIKLVTFHSFSCFRRYKYLQKTCMISLAISDLLTVVMMAMNYLDTLGKPLSNWVRIFSSSKSNFLQQSIKNV